MMNRRIQTALLLALAAFGCNANTTLVQPRTFDRPERVAVVCFDTEAEDGADAFVPMDQCDGIELDNRGTERFVLVALVTQTARGEVAAVDLRDQLVLDADLRVPGFTFVQVGESPSAVVVPELDPSMTYVANRTTRTIEWRDTAIFHPDSRACLEPVDDSDRGGCGVTRAMREAGALSLPSEPVDLVASPDAKFLYAALPAVGAVAEIAIDETDRTLTLSRMIALDTTVPPTVAPPAIVEYERVCPTGREAQLPSSSLDAARTPFTISASPLPVRLRVDTQTDPPTLLVADEGLPIIHRLSLTDTGADEFALAPLSPAVPTRDVAVTPNVPATLGASVDDEPARYLYAIDATDNSVLAIDYLDTSSSFGAVLPVNVGVGVGADAGLNQRDRLALSAGAEVLAVFTPEYEDGNLCDPADSDQADDATPSRHRGVFLAAGLQNGTVTVVDVFDLDAPCRGGAGCENPEQASDVHVRIRRHRPRIASTNRDDMLLLGQPALSFDGSPGQLDTDGQPSTGTGPGLVAFTECPPGMIRLFPDTTDTAAPIICGSGDAWTTSSQTFEGQWQGALPNAAGGQGGFDPADNTLFVARDARFCEWGTVGANDVAASGLPAEDIMNGYVGDRLLITSELPSSVQRALEQGTDSAFERCRPFHEEDRDPIFLEILEATPTTLRVQLPINRNADGSPGSGDAPVYYTLEDIQACFTGAVGYQVAARSAYVVRGSVTPFMHRVRDIGGACRVDASLVYDVNDPQTARAGRVRVGQTFVHPMVAFTIGDTDVDGDALGNTENIRSRLIFSIQGVPTRLAQDVGRIPSDIVFSPTEDRVFIVDVGTSALIQLDINPLSFIDTVQ